MQRTSAYGVPSYKGYIYLKTPAAEAQSTTQKRGAERLLEPDKQESCCKKQEKRHP